jgi:cytochrome P450
VLLENRRAAIQRGEDVDVDDCLSAMITNNLSNEEVADHMVTLIAAGHDTTAFFSAYMCMILAQHQDCQEILRKEIFDQLAGRTEVTADDVTEMKYLQKVMQETLRLYAIIPCVSRASTEEVHVKEANVTIPKGSNVLIPMFLINRDPELWDNPTEFRPDRFEGKGNEFTSAKNGFFPFGYGSRTCIGNVLAQVKKVFYFLFLLMTCLNYTSYRWNPLHFYARY